MTTTLPPAYPSAWILDVALRDGGIVRIRPIRPDDGEKLQNMVRKMSSQSAYHRFFRVKRELDPDELYYFTHLDYETRMAFVAVHEDEILGVGRFDREAADSHSAEVAFAVADEHQGRGLGTQLLQQLTAYSRELGVTQFRAFVLADNHAMLRVFRNAGFILHREMEDGVITVEFPTEVSEATLAAEWEHEQRAVAASMMPVFYPHSIAVVGASRNRDSIAGRLFGNLIRGGFTGPVYPVNPSASVIQSVKAYPSVLDIPDPVDLAFIVVPSQHAISAIEQCAEKGVKGLVVISAGFGETGEAGRMLEQEMLEKVRSAGMRMVGPNCMGVLNTDSAVSFDGQFGPVTPPKGNVAMSSQSGALGIAILDYATRLNIGISTFISVGNKADVSGNDLLLYWENDPNTDVILLYVESFGNPKRFSRLARRVGMRKPIVAVKSGRTAAGARAASSHTGSLASLEVAVEALFRQTGIVRTDTLSELFDVTALLANQPVPKGRKVGVLTNAGGPAILAVDALESLGLDVPELSRELQDALRSHLSPDASVKNPIDMIASAGPEAYEACLDLLLNSDEVDSVMGIYIPASPVGIEETAQALRDAGVRHRGKKTFLTVFMSSAGAPSDLATGDHRVPTYPFPEPAAKALLRAVEYGEWRDRDKGEIRRFHDVDEDGAKLIVQTACDRLGPDGGWLEPEEAEYVLAAFGLPAPQSGVAHSEDDAVRIAGEIGTSVVLKVISPSALHKSDVGGVALDVQGDEMVRAAYQQVTGAVDDAEGALVQEFVGGGHEVLIGMTEDPTFGPLIVFGLGGVFVELLKDVAFRLHPITDVDAHEMVRAVRSAKLLEGYRGGEPGDMEAVEEALLRISALAQALPEVVEMDLNPVKVHRPGDGIRVVDYRMRVRPVKGPFIPSRRDIPSEV
jgi:acetyl coenzyme A synthetase (ADP forming)-like protein